MKRMIFSLLAGVTVAISGSAQAELHEFTHKDGVKTFFGHLTNYNAKTNKVSVRRSNGRQQIFSADLLSEEDKKWVKEQYEVLKIGRNVRIDARVKHGDRKIKKTSGQKQIDSSKYFDIEISNSSSESVKDLTVEYEIHVTQGGKQGVIKGQSESIAALFSGVPYKFKSSTVDLKQKIPLSTATSAAGCAT